MSAAKILAHQSVEDGLARPSIPHPGWQHGKQDALLGEIVLQQHAIAAEAQVGGQVLGTSLAHQGMQQQTVGHLEHRAQHVLVRAVDGIAGLKTGHSLPAAPRDLRAGLGWRPPIV